MPKRKLKKPKIDEIGGNFESNETGPIAEEKAKLRSLLKNRTEGIDLGRIKNFLDELGLENREVLFINRNDIRRLQGKVHPGIWEVFVQSQGLNGFSIPGFNLAVIFRDKSFEKHNGITMTESLAVHEVVHNSGHESEDMYRFEEDAIMLSPPGQSGLVQYERHGISGWFFEEGLAELIAGEYRSEAQGGQVYSGIAQQFGREIQADETLDMGGIPVTAIYMIGADQGITKQMSASPAMGINLLCDEIPELRGLLMSSRSGPAPFDQIRSAIEEVFPGLYEPLSRLSNAWEDLEMGFMLIRQAIARRQTLQAEAAENAGKVDDEIKEE